MIMTLNILRKICGAMHSTKGHKYEHNNLWCYCHRPGQLNINKEKTNSQVYQSVLEDNVTVADAQWEMGDAAGECL